MLQISFDVGWALLELRASRPLRYNGSPIHTTGAYSTRGLSPWLMLVVRTRLVVALEALVALVAYFVESMM